MKPHCELMANQILPALRVLIVKKLVEEHGMKQTEIARRLGITQAAVSQYLHHLRGAKYQEVLRKHNLMPEIDTMVERILRGKVREEEFSETYCSICATLRKGVFK